MSFTLLASCRGCSDSSSVHQSFMSSYSPEKVRLRIKVIRIPRSFGKSTRSDPNFGVMSVLIVDLTPQTYFGTNHIFLIIIPLNISGNVLVV